MPLCLDVSILIERNTKISLVVSENRKYRVICLPKTHVSQLNKSKHRKVEAVNRKLVGFYSDYKVDFLGVLTMYS